MRARVIFCLALWSAPGPAVAEDAASLLARAKTLYRGLEYDQVIPLAERVLALDAATIEQKLDAYLLQGSCLAIIGNPIDAEKPFRFLLRGRPEFDLPADTPPKILAVFRKVQVEERTIAQQMRELERQRMIKELAIDGEAPGRGEGGLPLPFEYRVVDPRGIVAEMRLQYRRAGESNYSSLALERGEGGAWRTKLPAEWTSSQAGFLLEYFLETRDSHGGLLVGLGGAKQPLQMRIDAGVIAEAGGPFYESVWFWAATAAAVAASVAGGYLIYREATALPPTDLGDVEYR